MGFPTAHTRQHFNLIIAACFRRKCRGRRFPFHRRHSSVSFWLCLADGDSSVERELIIFQTPAQRTWLVVTRQKTFIVLDDKGTRARCNLIQGYFERAKTLPLAFDADRGAGTVRFSAQPGWWYYSVQLFASPSQLENAVEKLVAEA